MERDGESWVLRLFGRQDAMISGPTLESAKEQAFERVRQWAPCRIRVMGPSLHSSRLQSLSRSTEPVNDFETLGVIN